MQIIRIISMVILSVVIAMRTKMRQIEPPDSGLDEDTSLIPNFTMFDESGEAVDFDSYRGKPMVINFWASWCPYCVEELPDFDRAQGEYADSVNFLYIDLNDGKRETVEKALAYLEKGKYENITTLFDTEGNASGLFRIRSLPTTLFVDREGHLVDYAVGRTSYERLTGRVDSMLA